MISTIQIDGMRSVHCTRAVYTSLAGVAGIDRAEVSIGRAVVEHDRALDEALLADAVSRVGYALRAVITERRRLPVHGAPTEGNAPPVPPGVDRPDGDGER